MLAKAQQEDPQGHFIYDIHPDQDSTLLFQYTVQYNFLKLLLCLYLKVQINKTYQLVHRFIKDKLNTK